MNRSSINKILKCVLPLTDNAETYFLPNTHAAMAKVAEHFAMLLLFTCNDMVHKNKRRKITDDDVMLALEDMGMGRLVAPLKACVQRVYPKRERGKGGNASARGVSLHDLIEAGYLEPGDGVLSERYKGEEFKADLTAEGVMHTGRKSSSPRVHLVSM